MTQTKTATATAAERIVAGCVLHGPDEVDDARAVVSADDFALYPCRLVFETACRLRDEGRHIDAAAVLVALGAAGKAQDLGPNPGGFLADLLADAPTAANLSYAAGQVREAAKLRRLTALAYELIRDAADPPEPADDLAARFERQLAEVGDATPTQHGPTPIKAILNDAITRYDNAATGRAADSALRTGFAQLDRALGGFTPGQLIVVGARPATGKTALATRFATSIARSGAGVLLFSLEMSRAEIVDRVVASEADVSLPRLRGSSPMDPEQVNRVVALTEEDSVAGLPLWVDDRSGLTATAIAATARRYVRRHGVRLVVVDYLQLMKPENPKEPRYLQVGTSGRLLKELARRAGVTVLCLAQLNREVEARGDGKPRLSDLRDSGEIEQDADAVMLLHRLDDGEQLPVHRVDLILAKNRSGPVGTFGLDYHRVFTRFEERVPAP